MQGYSELGKLKLRSNRGVIEDFKKIKEKNFKRKKILIKKNHKNISRNFSGAVAGRVGSVQFQIAPCSSVHFSIYIGPFQHSQC